MQENGGNTNLLLYLKVIKARKEQKQTASGKKRTFLDHLLEISETGNHFTDEEIRDEVQTFVAAVSTSNKTCLGLRDH